MGGLNSGPGPGITLLIAIVVVLTQTALAAPVHEDEEAQESNSHALAESHGCYYNFQHYNEGERILTNEPCLNCTCRNRMLMCYLRVCPFTKGIGQNCTVEKVPGQCCPIITCPEVPVQLLTSTTTEHSEGGKGPSHYYGNKGTAVGHLDTNGCNIDGIFYPNGAQVPGSPEKPCELCYCIRNKTACIMQECALHVDGCRPVYEEGQCFPVRYQCDDSPYEEEPTTTIRPAPTPGLIITTTSSEPLECSYNNDIYEDGSRIPTEDPCEHCYCLKGKIACAVQECGAPLEKDGQNCTALPPAPGKCCPDSYQCDNNVIVHAKENFVRKDRKQKFEPKPIEHNDITMTSQGLSSGSEATTHSGVASVADAGHPTDSYHPDKATTEKPKLTTNRFDEESRVTEGVTPAKGIAEPSVTPEHQQELDKGTQKEKDSQPVKPIGDQKITFPDELQPVKGEATGSPVDHTDAHVIHMSPGKQPHPEIESHKQGVTPQITTNDVVSESSASSVKDPLIDKLHNIIQDVQSQVGDGKTSQMPEEVDIQTTTQSQKGHFTEKPDVLSHLPHSSTPGTEITNTTKESSPENTNILNQIQGIIQGIYSHVTDSIMSTRQPESTTEVGQLPGQQPVASEKEGIAGSYPGTRPEYPQGVTERPKRPTGTDYPEGMTEHFDTKHPQKVGSGEESYGTQHPDHIGGAGKPEGTTKYPETAHGTQYPEKLGGRPKDPTPAGQHPESVEVTGKPYDPSKYPEALKPDHHLSGVSGRPEDQTKIPEEGTEQYPVDSKHPQGYKPGEYPDGSKFPEGVSGKPEEHTTYPDGKYPDSVRPTAHYPESSGVTGKPHDFNKHPSGQDSEEVGLTEQYPEGFTERPYDPSKRPSGQYPGGKPATESSEFTGITGGPQYHSKYPEGVTGQYPMNENEPGFRPTGKYPESGKPHDQSQHPEGAKPSEKYPDRHKPIGEHPESVSGRPEDQTQYSVKPTGHYPSGSEYPEPAGVTGKPQDENKYPEGVISTEQYPIETKRPDIVSGKPGDGVNYPDNVKPSGEYITEPYPDGLTEKPEDYTMYPEGVTGRPDQTKYPHKPVGQHPIDSKYPEGVHPSGQHSQFKPAGGYSEQPHDKNKYPVEEYPEGSKYPAKPEDTPYGTKYPDLSGSPVTKYPEAGIHGRPQDPNKNTEDQYLDSKPIDSKHPGGESPSGYYPEVVTDKPEDSTSYSVGHSTDYPKGVSGKPIYPEKIKPEKYPGEFDSTEKHPDDIKRPEKVTEQSEDSTKFPDSHGTEFTESISVKPQDPSKSPDKVQTSGEYPEGFKPIPSDHQTKHPAIDEHRPSEHYPEVAQSSKEKYPHGGKPTSDDGVNTEIPEGVTGKPIYDKYPTRPGYPSRPIKPPQGIELPDGDTSTGQYPEANTGRPEDHTRYPGQRPGVFRPTGEYPDDSQNQEGVTGLPEDSTKYPYGHGTEYPEGVSGRPKDPSKYPGGVRPGDRYPEQPEGVTGRPEDHTRYPGQRPGVFRPTGKYPDDTQYPGVTGLPEDSTKYPYGHGTEYPEGVSGRPKDPSKYPGGVRPSDRYPDQPEGVTGKPGDRYPQYPEGVTGKPEDHTRYPGQRPGVFRPTGKYPDDSQHPEGVTGKPEDSTKYPYGHGTEYPEGVSGRPKDPSKYPEGTRPGDRYPEEPEGITGRPEDHTRYPGQRPGAFRPTEKYPDDSQHPEGVTGLPEGSTKYPYGHGTEYPEGVSGRPKDPSKYPGGVRPSDRYPDQPEGVTGKPGDRYPQYPEGVTGKPEDHTRYPGQRPGVFRPTGKYPDDSQHPEGVTGNPEDSTKYPYGHGTEYPEGVSGRPKDPSKYPGGVRPGDRYPEQPEGVTGRPEDHTRYPGQRPGVFRPTGKYPDGTQHPGATEVPEGSTEFPESSGTEYPEGVSGRPKDPSKYPGGTRPGDRYPEEPEGVTGRPEDHTRYPGQRPGAFRPTGKYPDDSQHPGVTGLPEDSTKYPYGHGTEYPDGVSGRPKDPSKYPGGVRPSDRYPQYPEGVTGRPEGTTLYPGNDEAYGTEYPGESDRPKDPSKYPGVRPGEGTKYPDGVRPGFGPDDLIKYPTGQIPNDTESFNQQPDGQSKKPVNQAKHPEESDPVYSKYPVGHKPGDDSMYPDTQDHTKHPFDSKQPQKPEDNIHGTEYPDTTGKPESGNKGTGNAPGEYPEKPISTEHPKGAKPSRPHLRPGAQDEPFGTEYPETTESEYESEYGTEYSESGTKHPMLSNYPTRRPTVEDKVQQKPVAEDETGTDHLEGSTTRPDSGSYSSETKRPGLKPESVTDISEGLKPSSSGHYPSGPGSTGHPNKKPEDESYGTEYPEGGFNTERPHYTSKYPEKPSAEDQLLVTEQPDSKVTSHLDGGEHPSEGKFPTGDMKHPSETSTEIHRPGHPEDSKLPTKDTPYGTESPVDSATSKYPTESKRPSGFKPAVEDGSKYPNLEDENKYPESITGKPSGYPSKPEDQPHGTEYPQEGITDYPKGKPQHPSKYPEGSEPSADKTGVQTLEDATDHFPQGTSKPSDQHSGTQYPDDVTKQPEYTQDSKQPDQSPTKAANTTKESTPNESTNILNQIQGIIQGIYSQVTDSIMSTIRPESTTVIGQEGSKPEGHYPHSGQTEMEQPSGTEFPDQTKYPGHLQGVTGKPHMPDQYPETDSKHPEGVAGHPDKFRPTGITGASTKFPQGFGSDEETYPTQYPDQTGQTGRPEGSTEYTHGDVAYGTEYPQVSGRPKEPTKFPQGSKPGHLPEGPKYPEGISGKPDDHTKYPEGITGHYPVDSKYPESIGGTDKTPESKYPEVQSSGEYPDGVTGRPEDQTKDSEEVRPTEQYPIDSKYPEGSRPTGSYPDESGKPHYQNKHPDSQLSSNSKDPTKLEGIPHGTDYPEGKPEYATKYPEDIYGTEYPGVSSRPKDPSKYPEGQFPEEYKPGQQTHDTKPTLQVDSKYPSKVSDKPEGVRPEKYPERITGQPEYSTKYPEDGEYPGVSGSPKDPSKYPEPVKPYHPRPTGSPYGTEYPDTTGQPEGANDFGITSKHPQKPEMSEAYGTDYPGAATHRPGLYPVGSKRPVSRPKPSTEYPEESTGRPEEDTLSTDYPTKDISTPFGKPKPVTENLNEVPGTQDGSSKYPTRPKPEYEKPYGAEYPETTDDEYAVNRPHTPTKHPEDGVHGTGYPEKESVTPDTYPQSGKPTSENEGANTEIPEGVTGKPIYDKYPTRPGYPSRPQGIELPDGDASTGQYPEANTGRPEDHTRYPGQRPGVFRPTGEYPDDSQHQEGVTGLPEDSTKYPYGHGTEYPEGVSGRPKDPSKYPGGVRPGDRYPEEPEGVTGRPEDHTRYPGQRPGAFRPTGKYPDDSQQPEGVTGLPEGSTKYPYGHGTEYPEGVSGRPKDPSKYPGGARPGDRYPEQPEGVTGKPGDRYPQYPEGVTGKPEDHTRYPGQRPGVFRPTGKYPDDSQHPEGVTGKPEDSTKYPYGHGTEYPEGASGKPKEPSKYPGGARPGDRYPEEPEGITGRPEDHTRYPGQRPGAFRPTEKYPDDSQHPEGVTGVPEGSTEFPESYATEYPEGVSGRPKDPSKYPGGVRPSDRYPEQPEGVTGKPEDHTRYPTQRPGVFKPTGKYPDDSQHPEGVTGLPEDSTKYPYGHGTEYPEGVSGRPKDPSKYPGGVRPSDRYPQYPEGVTGKPEDHTKYPSQRPGVFIPTGKYPDDSQDPEGVTGLPEDSTKYPYGQGTEYPEGASGRPKDPSKYPGGVRPSDRYPQYPEGVTGRPEGTTFYPESDESYGTEYPGESDRPKDPSKYPGVRPAGVTGRPGEGTKYPDGVRPGFRPTEKYPHKPEGETEYPESGETEKPEDVYPEKVKPSGQYSDSKYPDGFSAKPSGSTESPEGFRPTQHFTEEGTGRPEYQTKYPESVKPVEEYPTDSKHPEGFKPIEQDFGGLSSTGQYPVDSKPEEVAMAPGSKLPGTGRPEDVTKYSEGGKPTLGYSDENEPTENISFGVTEKPEDLTKYPQGVKPSDKYPSILSPSDEHPEDFKPTEKYSETSGLAGKPEDQTKQPGSKPSGQYPVDSKYPEIVKPTGQYPHGSKYPSESEYATEYPESSTKISEEFGTEYPEGVSKKPKDPTKYPAGVQVPEGLKPTEQYPEGVKPEESEPTKQSSSDSKYPENVTGRPEDQTKYPHVITGRPEGSTHFPEGDSHVTEFPGVSGRPKDPSKEPEGIHSGQRPAEFKPSEQYPDRITSKPDEHVKHPDEIRPSGHYPDGSEYPEPIGVTGKPHEMNKYPGARPTEPYGVDSKHPEEAKPSEKTPDDYVSKPGFKPTEKYPEEIKGKPGDDTKNPEKVKPAQQYPGVTGEPENATTYPEEDYGTEYPGMSSRPKDPSKYPEVLKPGKYPDGSKPTAEHPGLVTTEHGVTGKPDHTKYPEGVRPSEQHPEGFKPDEKDSQKPDGEYPQSITGQYPGATSRPHYSTKYPEEGKPLDKEGITDRPVYQTDYPEGAKPSEEYPEGFKPTGKYPVDSEHLAGTTDKTDEASKYPDGSKPSESKYPGEKPEEGKPSVQYPGGTKQPGGITGKPQDYTKYPEGGATEEPYDSSKRPQGVTGKPEDETNYPEGVTEHYPVGSKYPEENKPSGQYPESSEVTGKPHGVSKYPEDSKHPGTKYPEFSKPSTEFPYGQEPSEKYPDSETGKPDYSEGDSHVTEYPGASGRPKEPAKYPEGFEPTGQYPVDTKYPFDVTGRPEDVSKYPEHHTKYYPTGITSRPGDHTKYPESLKPGQRPQQPESEFVTEFSPAGNTGRPEYQTEYPEKFTGQYPGVSGRPQDGTKYPEDGAEVTHRPDEHYSKHPSRPGDNISSPESTKPSEQSLEGSKPFDEQPELSPNEQYPEGVTDKNTKYPGETVRPDYITKYPGVRPGEHQPEGSKYPEKPDSTEYPDVTGKYPEEAFGTEYPDGSKVTVQTGSKYPEGTTRKPSKRPGFKPSAGPDVTTILPMDLEHTSESGTFIPDLIEYTKKPKPEQPSETDAGTTVWPIHKYPMKRPQRPDGLGDESSGTEYPETTEPDFEYNTGRPDVTGKYPDDSKPGVSRPKPGTEYLPQGSEKPSFQTHGLDEDSLPSKETQTDRTPITDSEQGKPIDGLKPSAVDDYPSRPRPTVPGEGLYNEDVTQKPFGQTTSGAGVHPTVELTPDVKIPEGDLVAGQPEKYPTTEQPLESGKPVDGAIGQLGTNRHPETTSDDDLINKLHNIISGIQSQTNIPEQSTFSPQGVDEMGRPASTHVSETHTTTEGSHVTYRPQEIPGFGSTQEGAQHSDPSKPVLGQSTEDSKVSSGQYPELTESDKTAPHLPTESTFHTVTPQDEVQKQSSTDKPLHVVYPTYYPDGVVTRKPGAKPDDGDKKVTVTPQSTHEKAPEQGETHTVFDVQTEISSETATTPGVVIVEEVHTEVHSERPTKRPAITQPGSSDLTTHSGYQTEILETTKPSYVTVTPIGTISESDHIMHLYSTKEKHPATDIPTTQSFVTEPTLLQHTRFPSRKTTQTPIDELTTHKPQGASYVPYKLVNSTKVYYPEKEQSQKPFESGPYDGYDQIPYEVVNGTKFFYPNRIATEQPTTSASLGMYVPYKIINGTKVYYTQDPPQEPEKYDGLDYVPFEIINGTKVFYPERVSTTPSPTTAMYVPFKIVNGNKVYYPKDAKDEPQDVPDEYDGFDYVPFETVNGKKVFHPERVPNHTPAGSDYVPYKLMNNTKVYYPKDAQNEQENIPKGYDGVDSVPYDIIENEKVYYPEKASPQKPSAMFVPYKLVNGTKVYYPKHGQDKPTLPPEGYDGFDYIPYDTVNGTKVFHPERITPKPAYYPNKMFVPYKIVNNTKVFYPKDAQNKPRPLKPEYDGVEYLPYNVVNGTKVFNPPDAPTSAMYVPYVIKNGEKVYDLKKATDDPKGVPEGYDGIDYLPYEIKDGSMVFYPEKTAATKPKEGAMYVPYKLINGTKIYYADKATDQPGKVPEEYDGFDYLPYELQNGNKIFYPDRVATTTPTTPKQGMYVPYKLIDGKKVYQTDKATENPQDIPEEFDGFDYVPYDIQNGNKVFYPDQVTPALKEGAMYVPYKLINGTKVYYADKATEKPEDIPKGYDGFDYIPYKLQNGNKIFYPDKTATATTPVTPKQALYVPYKLIDGKKVYQTDKATENPQDIPEEFDGFDYVPYDVKNGNKVFYPERVKPTPKEGAMYVPYKLNNATKVYYADKATDKPEDISEDFDGFDYIPYEIQNGNKLFYPDRVATPTSKKAMYVPYKLDNGKKVYQMDKATDNPQGIPEKFDGFDYVPYDIKNGNKVFYPEKVIPTKGSEYVPYKIVKGMKVYHPEKADDEAHEIPEEFDGFDYLPFETQNGNKIFYPDRVTQPPKGAVYVPYKVVNGKKVYNPNKATNNPQDIPKGYDGCDYIPYEVKNGNKVFHPEQITTPAPTQGFMYVPYKLINGTKVYYADKATDKQEDIPTGYEGFDYLPYELQNGNKIFYPDRATTPAPSKTYKYIPYKLVSGRKVYYPDRAADTPEDIPKGYDGFDYLPIEYITKPQETQGMFVPYKTINGTKVYYPQEAHKRPHPLSDEYSGLDYMPYETINGTKVFYPEREPQAMYVPYKIINGSKVFYPKHAQRTPEEIPAGYDGLDYVPYDIVNGSQVFHPDRVPEYQGMFVPYKIVNGKKVFYPKYAQHKPMVMDGYDGFDYLPYENVNGTKVFKPEIPEQAMYVPYKITNGTKVYYPKFAQRKPEVPVGYDGSDYIPYQLVNGTKIFDPSVKPAMYVPYKIVDGTKVYYPKYAQHKPELIPSGYDGHDYLPYEVINGNKVFKPGQATPQEQITPQIKQAMYVPYKIVNGTKVYYPKHAQNKPEYIAPGYDGHDYLPYEIVNGNKIFKPEQMTPQIKQAMYVPYKIVNGTKVYYPKYAQNNPYLIPSGYDGFDYIPYEVVNGNKVFHPEQATTAPSPSKQAMYVPYKLVNGTKAYYPKHAQHTPTPVPFNYDGLDYLPYEIVNGTKIFEPQPHTKPTYLLGMFVPYKLSNNTKIFYPKDAHNKPHYVPQGYDGADYVPYEAVNNTKLFYPELISMAQPSTTNIPGIYVPFRLVNNKKVFYPKEATPFPPTVRYPYDGVAFVPYKSSVASEIIYVDEEDLTKPHTLSGHVPGEGNCYLNNRTYANNTEIAPVSPCQAKCTCISSVVRCVRVKCPPPPQNKLDCSPVYREGTCCPTYTCGDSENDYATTVGYPETKAPEGTSHGHDSESTTAFTDLTSQKRPGPAEGKPGQQSEEYHLHKPPKPSEHESLEPYDSVEGQLSPEEDYDVEDEEPYGPGTCRYAGKVYVSAQQIPRDDPCDFCFCFRSDIICLQQSCPPPIPGCRDEPIEGFCCPRYECHVKMATLLNVTSTTTTTTTTLPPHFFPHAYKGSATRTGCFVQGKAYRVGQPIPSASGPCMDCICGGNGRMKCEPKVCTPEPMIRKMMSPSESTTTSTNER